MNMFHDRNIATAILFVLLTLSFNSCFPLNENDYDFPGIEIKNGSSTVPGQYPYLVSIQVQQIFNPVHLCGGVLHSATTVLTVATCVDSYSTVLALSKLTVHAGVYNLANPDTETQQIATVSKVTLHPDYDLVSLDNDIAVLHLSKPLDLSGDFVSTIKLGSISTGDKCTVAGYGDTKTTSGVIEELVITGLPDEDCESTPYPGVSMIKFVYQPESMACGRNPIGEFCQGDQGGPLTCGGNLAGIASLDISCDSHDGYPSVYTQMDYYKTWVEEVEEQAVTTERMEEKNEVAEEQKQKQKDKEEENKQKKKDKEEENKQKQKDAEEENKQKQKDKEEENKQKNKDKGEENKQNIKDAKEENKHKKKEG